jgi:hypothetical protein
MFDRNGVKGNGAAAPTVEVDPSLEFTVTGHPGSNLIELSFKKRFDIRPSKFVIPLHAVDAITHAACTLRLLQLQGGAVPAAPSSPVPGDSAVSSQPSRG